MLITRTETELREARSLIDGDRVALVPTMGALHQGHIALVEAARAESDAVIASIFVNPLQFDVQSDLARYPADHDRDVMMLRDAGCAIAWLPTAGIMYPTGHATTLEVAGPADGFEGVARPGHFRGVATVVAILIGQTKPSSIWLGEKDWQQLQVVRRMIADLRLQVSVHSVQTVRASDGLALSSRNRFLTPDDRRRAPALNARLADAAWLIAHGGDVSATLTSCRAQLAKAGFEIEYLEMVDAQSLRSVDRLLGGNRLLAAARLGNVRLIDNVDIDELHS